MKRLIFFVPVAFLVFAFTATGQSIQFDQSPVVYSTNYERGVNYRSLRGVPLSSTIDTTAGSDGRGFSTQTPNQFRGMVVYGAVAHPTQTGFTPGQSLAANADSLGLSRATNATGTVLVILRAAQVGAPYLSRSVSFLFGAVVPQLAATELNTPAPAGYWRSEPYTTNNHAGAAYYWSPHAGAVFAAQAGPLNITWIKAQGTPLPLAGVENVDYVNIGGNYYVLKAASYVVSGAAAKPPRKMYWTESTFRATGKAVTVPAARVGAIIFAYNNSMPEKVLTEFVAPGQSQIATNGLKETRTIWYDHQQGQIFAYNLEGRIFMELLGDSTGDRTRKHLGYEIVDVSQQPLPTDITTELGELIAPYADGTRDAGLNAEPATPVGTTEPFLYSHAVVGSERTDYYAARVTSNQNDALVHWTEAGLQDLRWPRIYARYKLVWPADVAKYSHYIRPWVATDQDAQLTAVPLPNDNVPIIQYQDPLDQPRGKLTDNFAYYTWLTTAQPVHRALLLFTSGEFVAFERVISWLDLNLKTPALFANSIATNLTAWNSSMNTFTFTGATTFQAPRTTNQTARVGSRINPPIDETGIHLAGYINQTSGSSFHPTAYKDPFVSGFEAAQFGAIIPVNAIPGADQLDIWWFRPSATNQVKNLANGFKSIYWPAVIGTYKLEWPAAPEEIVLASNAGSGPLDSLQANGTIYTQNDPSLAGYNPNEEHALMIGGQAYALRDDLNKKNSTVPAALGPGATYSSEPFVLLDYIDADGRPNMHAFKVLREKPEAGIVFDYIVQAGGNQNVGGAGSVLQPPMPLPLLPPPVELVTNFVGGAVDGSIVNIVQTNYNHEPSMNSGDLPVGWGALGTGFQRDYANYARFTYADRKHHFWVARGLHSGLPALEAGFYSTNTGAFSTSLPAATAVVNQPFTNTFHVSRPAGSISLNPAAGSPPLPAGLGVAGLTLTGVAQAPSPATTYEFVITDGDGSKVTTTLTLTVVPSGGPVVAQGPLTIVSTNVFSQANVTYVGRPPFLANPATNTNSFTMRFYYKTQEGFAWPGNANPPAPGQIVPYLRPVDSIGDPTDKNTPSLDIVYRPVWPGDPPQMQFGETLLTPKHNLPAMRGQSSIQLLYQQSVARSLTALPGRPNAAVVLHDPTREKTYFLKTDSSQGLAKLPDSMRRDSFQGKTYFPNLPPHLARRFFFDPNRGTNGALVFRGEYRDEIIGEKYLLLNVLRGSDLDAVRRLCQNGDLDQARWQDALDGSEGSLDPMGTTVETFRPNRFLPGQFIVNTNESRINYVEELSEITDSDTAVDSYALSASGPGDGYVTLIVGNGAAFTKPSDPVIVYVLKVVPVLYPGELKVLPSENPLGEMVSFQHTADLGGRSQEYEYEWKINPPVDGLPPATDASMSLYQPLAKGTGLPQYTLGSSGIQGLVDNYVVMRYRPINPAHPLYRTNPSDSDWSAWTEPQLVEGWIKRVLAAINPFGQRVTDLYNNTVNTDASILTSAGKRWEGDIALNMDTINDYGLIEIYETVLHKAEGVSINAGINFGPANDALLLAAGYLNDLYMLVGNEAYADAANPTIGIGTKDKTYGEIATALFAFKGQVPSLLEEELALLRGRDDFLQPGVTTTPVYNRLVWNYTRGIDAGEVIYALNYNILDHNTDGKADAADAAKLYPQGHGDAYGHYLTALKGYYSLLMNNSFDWVPRSEAVTILGKAVQVDYLDERKFAAAAATLARTGRQVFDLTWRKDYQPGQDVGWEYFATNRVNASRTVVNGNTTNTLVREWGIDPWVSRTGQGAFLNWVVGNAILPDVDPDPNHEGIQRIDRTTVPELKELAVTGQELQTALDNAEGRLTPLGLAPGSLAFDINPNNVVGPNPQTHFEQIYSRAQTALGNAVASFDDAKDVTRLMRSEQDSLADFRASIDGQELAYTSTLIELYGTPYPEDIGAGKTYRQGYEGPDLMHFMYVDDIEVRKAGLYEPTIDQIFLIDKLTLKPSLFLGTDDIFDFDKPFMFESNWDQFGKKNQTDLFNLFNTTTNGESRYVEFPLNSHGYFDKPANWSGQRRSPGKIQAGIERVVLAHNALYNVLQEYSRQTALLATNMQDFDSFVEDKLEDAKEDAEEINEENSIDVSKMAVLHYIELADLLVGSFQAISKAVTEGFPKSTILGAAIGGDTTSAARMLKESATALFTQTKKEAAATKKRVKDLQKLNKDIAKRWKAWAADNTKYNRAVDQKLREMDLLFTENDMVVFQVNDRLRTLTMEQEQVDALLAQGDRIQAEREVFRQRAAAIIQGFRTRDAAFRIFRNEKLERYKSLFDLASRYAYLAANAYDYETGLLNTDAGKSFVNRIVNSRALGMVRNGEPQYAGSNTGDPGLSSALAEMKADWDVLKGRLGFNNPDAYGTTVSLRTEHLRILPGADGDSAWTDTLMQGRMDNLLDDADVRRYCMQIDPGNGLPVPGIVLSFSTTIAPGKNLFGRPLAGGDSAFNRSSFATKLYAAGVALVGYQGMNNPMANGTGIVFAGANPVAEPDSSYLNPDALAATPYVYLIPVGIDSMRSPPLGDTSDIRTWNVQDVSIPLPFNIGASGFSTKNLYQSSDSLTEPLFSVRKHQAFRPVSSSSAFHADVYGVGGSLQASQFTNRRLIGRSIWNSQWKLVIPGDALLNDPDEGLARFIKTVTDIKLHFLTYSYSGN